MKFTKQILIVLSLGMSVAWGQKLPLLPTTTQPLSLKTRAVISRPEGLLMVQNNQVIQHNTAQKALWTLGFPSLRTIISYDIQGDVLAVAGITATQDRQVVLSELEAEGKELGRWSLGKKDIKDLAFLNDKNLLTVADSAGVLLLQAYSRKGKTLWTQAIYPQAQAATTPRLLALPNDGVVLSAGGEVWALDRSGKVRWEFDAGQDTVVWNSLKLLKNGQVVLVGQGAATALNPDNLDGRVMCIDPKTGNQLWLKLLGDSGTNEAALDALEQADGNLLVLLQTPTGTTLVSLNTASEARRIAVFGLPFKDMPHVQYRQIVGITAQLWAVFGEATSDQQGLREGQSFLQIWGVRPRPAPTQRKPNLHLLSVGVSVPSLQFTTQDANAISKKLKEMEGEMFDTVRVETLTTAPQTTATGLGVAVERWPQHSKPQPNDWVVLFVSGIALHHQNDFRLTGSDYDRAAPRSTSVSLRSLLQDLNKLPGRKLVLLDVCQNGKTQKFDSKDFPNMSVMVACQEGEKAFESGKWQHGAFTKALLDGLSGQADQNQDESLALSELFAYLSETVPALTRAEMNQVQQPLWWLKGKDEILLMK